MHRVAFVTYAGLPRLAADDRRAAAELALRGGAVEPAVWDDPAVRWDRYDAIVVRSCWDYHLRPAPFADWLAAMERAGAPLRNPPATLRWNMDKVYLRDLAAAGVAVPPARYLEQGERADLAALLAEEGWGRAVVKPRVSATAHATWVATPATAAEDTARLQGLLGERGMLVQPFVDAVVAEGEWSLVFFAGRFSHAVLKRAAAGDFRVQDDFGGTLEALEPAPELLRDASRAVDATAALVGAVPLYARVDGVLEQGRMLLIELELIEPSLFLAEGPQADARFAEAILSSIGH